MNEPAFLAPFCAWLLANGSSCLELVATLFGVVAVYLGVRQKIWSWPIAIVNVALYAYIFRRAGLYSDAGLQVVYLVLSVYGWYQWLHGGANRTVLPVTRASRRTWMVSAVVALATWLILGTVTSRMSGAAIPWLDAALTTGSLVAQWMMTRKLLESWILWIVLDLVYVPMFMSRGLPLVAVNYAVYLVLAVLGLRAWLADLRARERGEAAAGGDAAA